MAFQLALLAITGGLLPNAYFYYSHRRKALNLYVLAAGRSGSGKGILSLDRRVGEEAAGETPLFVPPLVSGQALTKELAEYRHGVLFSEECGPVLRPLRGKWGNYREVLLKGYHQETIGHASRNEGRVQVREPAPGLVVGGEPGEIRELIGCAPEGFRARVLFHELPGGGGWESKFGPPGKRGLSQGARRLADLLGRAHRELLGRESALWLHPSEEARALIDQCHAEISGAWRGCTAARAFESSLKRSALQATRIASIVTLLRAARCGAGLGEVGELEVGRGAARLGLWFSLPCLAKEIDFYERHFGLEEPDWEVEHDLMGEVREFFEVLPYGLVHIENATRTAIKEFGIQGNRVRDLLADFAERGLIIGWNGHAGTKPEPGPIIKIHPRTPVEAVYYRLFDRQL